MRRCLSDPLSSPYLLSSHQDDELVDLKWRKQDTKEAEGHDVRSNAWSSKMGQMFKNRFQQ